MGEAQAAASLADGQLEVMVQRRNVVGGWGGQQQGQQQQQGSSSSRVLAPSVIRRQQQLLNDPPLMALMEMGPSWPRLELGAAGAAAAAGVAGAAAAAAAAGTRGRLEGLRRCFSALGMDHCPPTAAEGGQAKEVLPQEQRQRQQPRMEHMQAARASRQADMEPDPDQPAQENKLALPGVETATSSILPNRRLGQGSAGGGGQVGGEGERLGGEAYQLPPSAALLTWQLLAPDSVLVRLAHLFQVGEDPDLSQPCQVDLGRLQPCGVLGVGAVKELSLSASQYKQDMPLRSVWPTADRPLHQDDSWPPRSNQPLANHHASTTLPSGTSRAPQDGSKRADNASALFPSGMCGPQQLVAHPQLTHTCPAWAVGRSGGYRGSVGSTKPSKHVQGSHRDRSRRLEQAPLRSQRSAPWARQAPAADSPETGPECNRKAFSWERSSSIGGAPLVVELQPMEVGAWVEISPLVVGLRFARSRCSALPSKMALLIHNCDNCDQMPDLLVATTLAAPLLVYAGERYVASRAVRAALLCPVALALFAAAPHFVSYHQNLIAVQSISCILACCAFKVLALCAGRGVLAAELNQGAGWWRFMGAFLLPVVPTGPHHVPRKRAAREGARKLASALAKLLGFAA
ncbi:hypothetical protein QJQ45_023066, partial [Haematococcus lacustris]